MAQQQHPSTHYKTWDANETVEWMVSINPTRFEKYREGLTTIFKENGISGIKIDEFDREDLKDWGIINLDDRKTIYKRMIILMAEQKRRDSQIKIAFDASQLLSISDDEDDKDDQESNSGRGNLLSSKQFEDLKTKGFCKMVNDGSENVLLGNCVSGYCRENYRGKGIVTGIIDEISNFIGNIIFDPTKYIQLVSGGQDPMYYLTTRTNASLSKFCTTILEGDSHTESIEIRQVPPETLGHVLSYLGHHKGIEPDPLPVPVRSIYMNQICPDVWDADFIDAFDKKTIFEIILGANYLDIKGLVHLGAAKIATLIKQLDQQEINRIIEEEERYRREQAEKKRAKEMGTESMFGLADQDEDNKEQENGDKDKDNNDTIKAKEIGTGRRASVTGLDEEDDANLNNTDADK